MVGKPIGERVLTNAERQARFRDARRGEALKVFRPIPPLRGPRAGEWFTEPEPPQAGAYRVICADPPWAYEVWSAKGQGRSPEYPKVPLPALKLLPAREWASREFCALFLWTTWSHLPQALELMAAWGFTYSTGGFLWAKTRPGTDPALVRADDWWKGFGPIVSVDTEPCLLGFRGGKGGKKNRLDTRVRQLVVAPRTANNSEKPAEVMRRIERLYAGPRLEIFARHSPRPGWDAWGNQVGLLDSAPPHA